ncbi:MAG: hypothetical protein NVSMB54_33190 [Ktedonobacteraceae bacterium]
MTLPSYLFCDTCGAANRVQATFCKACGQPLHCSITNGTTSSSTLTGFLVHQHILKQRYVVLAQVGRGGFGAVYKAADTQFGNRLVAIKEMSQSNMNAQELLEATLSFKREALMLAGLTHPNLPRIYEQFTDGGRSYLVMDFIDGKTLEAHLADLSPTLLPSAKTLTIGIQLCDVLSYLHSRQPPIIFRDLKPANVMLTLTGHIYLIDFGIARHFKPGQSKDTTALGSTGYAAPEQYGKSQTTVRADIYGLGATLHQLITGHDPSDSPFTFSPLALKATPTLAGLDTLLASMVNIDINKRPATILTVKQELQRIATQHQQGQIHSAHGTLPSIYQLPTTLPKTPAKASKGAIIPPIPPMSNMLFACCGHSSRVTTLAWSPNGKWLASASYDKTVQVWDASNGRPLLTYKEHRDRVNALAWSPDSIYLASASDDGTARVWHGFSGKPLVTYYGHNGPVNALTWSPMLSYGNTLSSQIASAGTDKTVHVWDASQGTHQYIFRNHTDAVYAVAWSPDGRRIASAGEDRLVLVWNPVKEQPKKSFFSTLTSLLSAQRDVLKMYSHDGRVNDLAWSPDSKYIASASSDHWVLIRDALTGTTAYSYGISRKGMKNCVAWAPNGKHLASGGNDKTVELWSIDTKGSSFVYHGHVGYVTAVAWSPDSTRVASAGVDRTVQVWQAV